jgi:hypothetical protein
MCGGVDGGVDGGVASVIFYNNYNILSYSISSNEK